MNKLVLIGNGFDLAHGLETSYKDFLVWYLKRVVSEFIKNHEYEDGLFKLPRSIRKIIGDIKSIDDFISYRESSTAMNIKIESKSTFLEDLISQCTEFKWVDIEYIYYKNLIEVIEAENFKSKEGYRDALLNLRTLHISFDAIKKQLIEYLKDINTKEKYNKNIEAIFTEYICKIDTGEHNNKLFLNFNYTSTIKNYWEHFKTPPGKEGKRDSILINIHGSLNDDSNPIIFGYGDEMDSKYEELINLNDKEFLTNLKTYWYHKTDNYQNLKRFIDTEDFKVFILGHSCGVSDRSMLNRIFEHNNCRAIQIFYHQQNNQDDFFTKTQEISRHFNSDKRKRVLDLIVPQKKSCPLS